jgi:hypothetical protein
MPTPLTCATCPAMTAETRWYKRLLCWRLKWRCGLSGRYVSPDADCTANTHDLRRMEQFCQQEQARRGVEVSHTLLADHDGSGLVSARRIVLAHDDRAVGGGCQWRFAQDAD